MSDRKPPPDLPSATGFAGGEESEEFDFQQYASAPDAKMSPSVPMAPPGGAMDDDYNEKLNRKMAAAHTTAESSSSSMTRQQKELMKAGPPSRLKDPPPRSIPHSNNDAHSGSFLHRPDRYQAKMAEYSGNTTSTKGMYHNTGTSTPGAQWNAPPRPAPVNAGPLAEVQVVPPIQQAQEAPVNSGDRAASNKDAMRMWILVFLFVIVAVLGVAVVVVLVVRGGDGEVEVAAPAQSSRKSTPAEEFVLQVLENHDETIETIQNQPDSPQAQAFAWITTGNVEDYSDAQVKQRFALASLYYATGGENWKKDETTQLFLDDNEHECLWLPTLNSVSPCNRDASESNTQHSDVQHISLQDHGLEGSLPTELSWLTGLESLDLFGNTVQGPIPSELGLLTKLTKLDLSGNAVTGTIPPQLGNLANLEELYLEQNMLRGNIPSTLNNTSLEYLRVKGNNDMRGTIPETVCAIPSLTIDCGAPLSLCGCTYCACGGSF